MIRMTHKRLHAYLKTEFYATAKQLDKEEKVKDKFLLKQLYSKIEEYEETILKRLGNKVDLYTASELKDYLIKATAGGTDRTIDFVHFAKSYILKVRDKQKARARRMNTTLNALIDFWGREKIPIVEITSKALKGFEEYLLKPHSITRTNQLGNDVKSERPPLSLAGVRDYMTDLRVLFNRAKEEFNDDDKDEILILHYPFTRYKMPQTPDPEKRNLDIETVRRIINAADINMSGSHGINRANLARDVFALSFFLVGMNTIDLYNADKLENGRLIYNRTKTRGRRKDDALISIRIEPEVMQLIEKYRDIKGIKVFSFHEMYSTYDTFNANVNKGLKHVAETLGIADGLSTYYARHSWATIARNNCKISKDDIDLALNHVDEKKKVVDFYIAKDWSIIDDANRKVIDFLLKSQ
jgi:integrase